MNMVGNDGVISIGGNDVAELKSWTFDSEGPQIDDTVMGDQYRTAKAGTPSAKGTIECLYDPTDTTGQEAMLDALLNKTSVVLVLYPGGNSSGKPRFTMTVAITSDGISGAFDEIIPRKFAYSLSEGTVVRDTVP